VIEATQSAIDKVRPASVVDVRQATALVQFSTGMRQQSTELKTFLFQHLYRHPQVTKTMELAKQVVQDLFVAYSSEPSEMQPGMAGSAIALSSAAQADAFPLQRAVSDYVAGMTDRFASREHERLTGKRLLA
jgi:dGTPase